jgi:hypothetical protein
MHSTLYNDIRLNCIILRAVIEFIIYTIYGRIKNEYSRLPVS